MKKKHPVLKSILIVMLLTALAVAAFTAYMAKELAPLNDVVIEALDLTAVKDGIYDGNHQAGPIDVALKVTVTDHRITQIDLIKHENGQGGPAEAILKDVIASQSLQVDAITGATYSSKVILLAIEDALKTQ